MKAGKRASARGKTTLPSTFTPQLATLVAAPPDGREWVHEIKIDGYRIGCRIEDGSAQLFSRNGNDWTARFPSVCAAAAELKVEAAWLDGEVAIVVEDGRTSFQALQNALGGAPRTGALLYFVFDLLHLDGMDVAKADLLERKAKLAAILPSKKSRSPLRYVDHTVGDGERVLREACRLGLEGIVSKRIDLPYQHGRGRGWLKTKCVRRQEFVIGGFTDPEGARVGLGALLLGVYDEDRLVYAGKVGTGFTQASAIDLRQRLDSLTQTECPFANRPAAAKRAHWVKPRLVAEVAFTEWTSDGKIRHPSFQGLRADKSPRAIVREVEQSSSN